MTWRQSLARAIVVIAALASPQRYVMDHDTSMFTPDGNGHARLLATHEAAPESSAHDIRQLPENRQGIP